MSAAMTQNAELALEVRGLRKAFGGLPATNDVSLSIAAGERRLIIGPNGAGKTTTRTSSIATSNPRTSC